MVVYSNDLLVKQKHHFQATVVVVEQKVHET